MSEHKELGLAFSKVMRELAGISFKKDAFNGGKKNNYITLDAINSHLLPILRSNDLCFIVHRDADQNFWGTLTYLPTLQEYSKCFGLIDLNHTGKKSDGSEYELMNTAQAQGATLSYGRRYVTTCFFNLLVDTDTDGETGYKNQGNYSSNSYSKPSNTQAQSQPQGAKYPKIENQNITITSIKITKKDFKDSKGVFKDIVDISTKEGEKEGLFINSFDSKGERKSELQVMAGAVSQLIQTKKDRTFVFSKEVVQLLSLTQEQKAYFMGKKGNNEIVFADEFENIPF